MINAWWGNSFMNILNNAQGVRGLQIHCSQCVRGHRSVPFTYFNFRWDNQFILCYKLQTLKGIPSWFKIYFGSTSIIFILGSAESINHPDIVLTTLLAAFILIRCIIKCRFRRRVKNETNRKILEFDYERRV